MQARTVRSPRLLRHHFMQTPYDGPPPRHSQRHAQAKGVDRHGVGGGGGVEIVQNARGHGRKGVAASRAHAHAGATTAGPIQGLQARLQRRQSVRLRVNVHHLFYMRPDARGESSEAERKF